jgi:hypothetical protein
MLSDRSARFSTADTTSPLILDRPEIQQQLDEVPLQDARLLSNPLVRIEALTAGLNDHKRSPDGFFLVTNEDFQPIHEKLPKIGYIELNNQARVYTDHLNAARAGSVLSSGKLDINSVNKVILTGELPLDTPLEFSSFVNQPSRLVMAYYDLQLGVYEQIKNVRQYQLNPVKNI